MADDPIRDAAEVPGREPPIGDMLAERARLWYLEAWNSAFWRKFRDESKEDTGFYVGGKAQWSQDYSTEDFEKLKASKRAVLSINHCLPQIEALVGYERRNRFDIKAAPQGGEDAEDTELLSWLLKFVQDQSEVPEYRSECFENGAITGLSCLACEIDWSENAYQGEIVVSVLRPGEEVVWDPHSRRYDLRDARYVLRYRWVFSQDLYAEFPEHAKEIEQALSSLGSAMLSTGEHKTTEGPVGNRYGDVRGHPVEDLGAEALFYDPDESRILVLEAWYRDYEWRWMVVDKEGGKPETKDAADEPLTREAAMRLAEGDPDRLKAIRRRQRKIRMATILPATYQTIEDGPSPYDNDDEDFPFVPYWAFRQGDEVWGLIRNLKDPQRIENKRWSQLVDILAKYANLRIMYQEGSVTDPKILEEPFSTAPIPYRAEPGEEVRPPGYLVPPLSELVVALRNLAVEMGAKMREIGLNAELMGLKEDASSGVAIARRQQQGELIATRFFDNHKRTGKLFGQRLARRVAQRFTTEDVLRLTNPDTGEAFDVTVNPVLARKLSKDEWKTFRAKQQEAGRPRVLRDPSAMKYDVIIAETPATPSARATKAMALIEIAEKFEALFPILIEDILELLELPNRARVLAKFKQSQQISPETGTPTGANGGPNNAIAAALGRPLPAPPGGV